MRRRARDTADNSFNEKETFQYWDDLYSKSVVRHS
jgi:hypothetical protein